MKNITSFNDFNTQKTNEAKAYDKNTLDFIEDLIKLMEKYDLHFHSFQDINIRKGDASNMAAYLDLTVVSPTTLKKWLKANA